jgi:predicted NAD-dependent protein-ADP-ribosyltransferase YbiA (DUF1768 family)
MEIDYNNSLREADITRVEAYDPTQLRLLTYSTPTNHHCGGILLSVGNMSHTFPFDSLGTRWSSVEYLYLCGEWSLAGVRSMEIQKDILTARSGYAAKRYKKSKYKREIREDFTSFRHMWMLWCVWEKCRGSEAFRNHLTSLPDDRILVEMIKADPVWAAYPDDQGILRGSNGMGKILTICRQCIDKGSEPNIDRDLLNLADIHILGERIHF